MIMQKDVLLVACENSAHLICELPRLFKNAGFRVTVLAFPHWNFECSSYIDEFIATAADPEAAIEHTAALISQRPFLIKILACDALNWALIDSGIDPLLKAQLSPIGNPSFMSALGGKVEAAAMRAVLEIPSPPAKPAHSLKEAAEIAIAFGFPVLLKESRSGAGEGVFKCATPKEVMQAPLSLGRDFLVEKYIEGDLISVEPLYWDSRLIAYSSSKMTHFPGPY